MDDGQPYQRTLEQYRHSFYWIGCRIVFLHVHVTGIYGTNLAEEYLRQLEEHEIYRHDETAVVGKPYCASVTLYPFLFKGNTAIGGTSDAPRNLASFNGAFINLVFALAAQFCGAVSTPEWLA